MEPTHLNHTYRNSLMYMRVRPRAADWAVESGEYILHIVVANPVQRGADLAEEYKMMADGCCPTSPELTELVKAPLKVYYSGSSNVTIALQLLPYVGIVPSLLVNVAFKGAC